MRTLALFVLAVALTTPPSPPAATGEPISAITHTFPVHGKVLRFYTPPEKTLAAWTSRSRPERLPGPANPRLSSRCGAFRRFDRRNDFRVNHARRWHPHNLSAHRYRVRKGRPRGRWPGDWSSCGQRQTSRTGPALGRTARQRLSQPTGFDTAETNRAQACTQLNNPAQLSARMCPLMYFTETIR